MLQSDDKIKVMAIKLNGKDKKDKGIRTPTQTEVFYSTEHFFVSFHTKLHFTK